MASTDCKTATGEKVYESHLENAHVSSKAKYDEMYKESIEDPEKFWGKIAEDFYWKTPVKKGGFLSYNFDVSKGRIYIKCMEGAKTNLSYNLLDRNVHDKGLGDKVAFYWEGNDPEDEGKITYKELLKQVCMFSNVLKSKGVKKGDRVAIYMPMILELVIAVLACTRIGAVHSVIFGGFSSDSLSERIVGAKCCLLITADGAYRGTKLLHLKEICDQALVKCSKKDHTLKCCIVVSHLNTLAATKKEVGTAENNDKVSPSSKRPEIDEKVPWNSDVDCWWHELMDTVKDECEPVWMDAEDPLFMLYTSGSTGKPKGVLHTTGGYLLYAATTFKYVFDYHPDDIYWCTADIGWITGHTYVAYGPLANGATSVLFEGIPFHPDSSRYWAIVDKYKVTKFYTAPTAVRSLMKFGDTPVTKYSRKSLKVLGSVGEPINPEAWLWYYNVVGNGTCPIVDTFWQTETGGHMLTPLPGCTPAKPGSACWPFFGVIPAILDESGKEIEGTGEGYLVFKKPWPGIMRTVYGDHDRYESTYFTRFPGYYCTGDGARRDEDGYLWITGRVDDMLNVSGHLMSTAEVESALIEHKSVAEAAVVAHPHPVKGECLYCFITTVEGCEFTPQLVNELRLLVRMKIGPFATPEYVQRAEGLPKTRSGKIMRRVLRKIACGDHNLGDVSTMADESVIGKLFQDKPTELKDEKGHA